MVLLKLMKKYPPLGHVVRILLTIIVWPLIAIFAIVLPLYLYYRNPAKILNWLARETGLQIPGTDDTVDVE